MAIVWNKDNITSEKYVILAYGPGWTDGFYREDHWNKISDNSIRYLHLFSRLEKKSRYMILEAEQLDAVRRAQHSCIISKTYKYTLLGQTMSTVRQRDQKL